MESAQKVWDVIVVGAGPAGCAAAYDLAVGGRAVLLLDKKFFPRLKACAGGLTTKAVKALRYPIDPVVRETTRQVRLEWESPAAAAAPIALRSREPICVMTVRAELDAYCLKQTLAAGATFQTVSSLRQIVRFEDGVHLVTNEEVFRTRFLIGADGANGQVRPLCAEGPWFSRAFALEVQVAAPPTPVDVTFDFAAIPNGYGWIFPKKDHLNVGLYLQAAGGLVRDDLLAYVRAKTGTGILDNVAGQYLGMGAGEYRADSLRQDLRGRVFLVGDAGGFVDALTGEGIYGALVSGQAAAGAILAEQQGRGSAVRVFETSLQNYRQTLSFSSRAAVAFYADPARGFRLMRLPLVRRVLVKTYTHGLNVKSLPMRIALARA